MRKDLPINLPTLPFVCDLPDCGCAGDEDGSEDMRVVFKASRAGSYDAEIRNEYGDLIDVLHADDINEALQAAHIAYPFATSATIENNHGPGRGSTTDDLDTGATDD